MRSLLNIDHILFLPYGAHINNNDQVALKTLFDTRVDETLKKEYLDEVCMHPHIHTNRHTFVQT